MQNVLFLNTADKKLQVAIWKDGEIKTYIGGEEAKRHNAALLPVVDDLLSEVGLTPKEITAIVCVSGPGSFTGIRSGASFSNGFMRATGAKLCAPTTLEIVGAGDRAVTIDAKHGNYYTLIVKDGQKSYAEMTDAGIDALSLPRYDIVGDTVAELIAYGLGMLSRGETTDNIRPFYLKKSSAEREHAD